ncbi:hypothetical protein DFH05DRAFT_1401392 [Lentinula detonsa]|uniref:RING-type domain-containing protein n=1 Tax=Lentinula detonsa TaxID=2804962 RepID=A0A9W8NX54_9AGAR|nr:hypothetical protein DFH05DRAFT_1401392 [Lentinula detonsa]
MARSESKPYQLSLKGTGDEYQTLYCSLCDVYLYSKNLLRQHMEASSCHPRCNSCHKSFLNLNSLRRHYLLSNRHNYCATCDKSFATPLALKIHFEYATFHRDARNEDEDALYVEQRRHKGWENRVAADIERRQNVEDDVVVPERDALSRIEVTKKILQLKQRMSDRQHLSPKILKQTCAICLCVPKKMCVTRCGHMFCSSCIHQTFEQGQGCPTCRKLGVASQLRKVDLCNH